MVDPRAGLPRRNPLGGATVVRIVIEIIILCLIVGALVGLSRLWSGKRGVQHQSRAATVPPEATWRAIHVGNENNQTEVLVVLQVPGKPDLWDRRTCAVIDNQDPEYDKRLYNAMEDARSRAVLLNNLRDT